MWSDLYLLIGGMLGAFIRRLTNKDEPTWSRQMVTDVVVSGAAMVAVNALGLIPPEWVQAALANPIRAIAVSAIPGIAGIDLLRNLAERWTPTVNKAL